MELFLIVEDDAQIRNFINFSLASQSYGCMEASDARSALDLLGSRNYSAIILDLGLPDMDGIDFLKQIRLQYNTPVIIVSARDQDIDKVEALDAGADDYLTKPFSVKELLARIRVILRHNKPAQGNLTVYKVGDLELDIEKHKVLLEGTEIHFTPMEYELLTLLVRNAGKVLTHNYILKEVWGTYLDCDTQTLRVFMANIRRKLEKAPASPRYIITEVGVGYRFTDE